MTSIEIREQIVDLLKNCSGTMSSVSTDVTEYFCCSALPGDKEWAHTQYRVENVLNNMIRKEEIETYEDYNTPGVIMVSLTNELMDQETMGMR